MPEADKPCGPKLLPPSTWNWPMAIPVFWVSKYQESASSSAKGVNFSFGKSFRIQGWKKYSWWPLSQSYMLCHLFWLLFCRGGNENQWKKRFSFSLKTEMLFPSIHPSIHEPVKIICNNIHIYSARKITALTTEILKSFLSSWAKWGKKPN